MSIVTNVIISFSLMESDGPILSLNGWLISNGHRALLSLNDCEGGEKRWEAEIWGGAFNCLDHEGFLECIRGLPWSEKDGVSVFWQQEDALRMTQVIGGIGHL